MEFVFGPVASRRLGLSLGVNIIPHKICCFDCLYCEVGKTTNLLFERKSFFNPEKLMENFNPMYEDVRDSIDVVTVTGAGEPTLNSDLGEIADLLKEKIHQPLALLTNSSLIDSATVQKEMLKFDIVVPSIDAVTEDVFKKINRPHPDIKINNIIEGLIDFSNNYDGILYPEVLVLKNINDGDSEIKKISEVINRMKYETVHLNTAYRPGPYKEAVALNEGELTDIALLFAKYGVNIEISNFISKKQNNEYEGNLEQTVLKLLDMRPCTKEDICNIFSISESHCENILTKILNKNKIKLTLHNGTEFFSSSKIKR